MSFSDFAGNTQSSASSRPLQQPRNTHATAYANATTTTSNSESISNNKALTIISDALLQYQRNVGILEKIVQSLGATSSINPARGNTNSHWNETIAQYEAQTHVLQQLEEKLKVSLQPSQPSSASNPTAMIKLQRDFERVQIRVQQLQDMATTKISSVQQQQQSSNLTNSHNTPFFLNSHNSHLSGEEDDAVLRQYQQQQLLIQQEDRLQEEIMREREEEIRNINRGMHTVNEIYKDLAHIVSQQQHDIDTIETQMDQAHTSAQQGLQQVEKANEKYGQGNCTIM